MKRKLRKNVKGISTVIATIIIVAISIVMAIAVAYWALGIGGSFTRFEKIQITSAYVTTSSTTDTIHINLKNTGTTTATFDPAQIQLNGIPISACTDVDVSDGFVQGTGVSVPAGGSTTGTIVLSNVGAAAGTWQSGMNIEAKIITTAGNQYPQVIVLP